jgi:hypothetical protein
MKVICPRCGFEDEGNFCSNCGAPLQAVAPPSEQQPAQQTPAISWLERCPVCKSGALVQTVRKKLFGLAKSENLECDKCNAVFTRSGDRYKLTQVRDTSAAVWQDYGKQSLTEREWTNISLGGMSDSRQEEADIERWMMEIRQGNILVRFGGESPIIIKKNEEFQFALPNITLSEPRAVRQTTGGYAGPTVRVAKGVSFRVGGFAAKGESHEELRSIDQGTLILTNKRLVFSGTKRTIDTNLAKILSVESLKDGIALRTSGKTKTQYFTGTDCAGVSIAIDGREYQKPFSGLMLMYIIESLTQ